MRGVARQQIAALSVAGESIVGKGTPPLALACYNFPPGSTTAWVCPTEGFWQFALWGGGGNGAVGLLNAGSGGFVLKTKRVRKGEVAAVVCGRSTESSTVTFADGLVLTANPGATGTDIAVGAGGTATGGDVNLAGTVGGGGNGAGTGGGTGSGGGAGAPGVLPYRGADGSSAIIAKSPGAGSVSGGNYTGGEGLVLAVFVGG